MATYDNLPVYKASYDLLLEIFIFSKSMGEEHKYTIREDLKKEATVIINNIITKKILGIIQVFLVLWTLKRRFPILA